MLDFGLAKASHIIIAEPILSMIQSVQAFKKRAAGA